MCGITGYTGNVIPDLIRVMNATQAHRGPDGQGIFEDPLIGVSLGHTRLAILDLSDAAAQPMHSFCGRYVIVYNGEIYNYRELRRELSKAGWDFRSAGDTEVLLAGLATVGVSFIERLNGIFAFALWDRREATLLLARDQLGVKPLYFAEPREGVLVFASEIKSLLLHPDVCKEPDFLALYEHLARGHASGMRTAFRSIKRLPPGTLLHWNKVARKPRLCHYGQTGFSSGDVRAEYEASVAKLNSVVKDSVRRQMVSDVPVGAFLSGGLDSSAIALLGTKATDKPLHCFTISYPATENKIDNFIDDLPYAKQVAEMGHLPFTNIEIKPQIAELLPRLVWHMDEPLTDPAIITCYLICRLAREEGVPVLLSGQGADELFGGYPRYPAVEGTRWLEKMPIMARRVIASISRTLPASREGRFGAIMRRMRRVLVDADRDTDERFMAYASSQPDSAILRVFSPEVRAIIGEQASADYSLRLMVNSGIESGNRYIFRDMIDYLPNHNLLYTDKMSMAVGVEVRVPLIDLEIIRLAVSYPFDFRCQGKTTKRIFRDAVRDIVPESVLHRRKAGFGAPYRKWLRYDLADLWHELTSESVIRLRGWFDYEALQNARARSQSGKDDLYMLQWAVLTTELWARTFLDRDPNTYLG